MSIINLTDLDVESIILLNEISDRIKQDFNNLIEDIFKKTNGNLEWLVSSTLSRNPYLSDIYLSLCYLLFVKYIYKEKKVNISLIIAPDYAIKEVLVDYFYKENINIKVIGPSKHFNIVKSIMKSVLSLCRYLYRMTSYLLLKKKTRIRKISKPITIIDTFFLDSMFRSGKFEDRYYNGLLSNLSKDERDQIYFLPTLSIKSKLDEVLKIADKSEEKFIYSLDYLNISDYLSALFRSIRSISFNFNQFIFFGFKIGPILKRDQLLNIFNYSSLQGINNYLFIRRLKESGIKLRLVIDWFENQVIDRGFNRGIKDYFPNTPSIGYQGYIISTDFNFYIQPTIYEQVHKLIPDEIAVVGNGLRNDILKFNNRLIVNVAPAFRFSDVWEKSKKVSSIKTNNILIVLPIAIKECMEILSLVINAYKMGGLNEIHFHIKTHPSFNITKLKKLNLPDNFILVNGTFRDCILDTDMMLGNTSSTCLEAIAMGIPVIIIGSQSGLTQNPIPKNVNKNIWREVYTAEDLKSSIIDYFISSEKEIEKFKQIGEEVKRDYFQPVTEEGVRKFLKFIK
jgi:surface carbohydrate biosynthesis protein (TIGR04326 family)